MRLNYLSTKQESLLISGTSVSFEDSFQQINYTISHKPLFNHFLAFILTEDNIPATRHDERGVMQGLFTPGPEFRKAYVDGFSLGEKEFHMIALHSSNEYILEKYENTWSTYINWALLRISNEFIEKLGLCRPYIVGL